MSIQRFLVNLCAKDLDASASFYTSLLSFEIGYSSDWFIQLVLQDSQVELGIILEGHELCPEPVKTGSPANYLTFVVERVESVFEQAQTLGYQVIQAPTIMPYGQKRMLVAAPEGTIIDVSSVATT